MDTGNCLVGRVALVTGGGGEIGGAIARLFAAEGAALVIGDTRLPAAEAVAAEIIGAGGRAVAVEADVSRAADAEAAVRIALTTFGKLTTLVNVAAAVTPDGTVETLTLEDWRRALDVNLTGAFAGRIRRASRNADLAELRGDIEDRALMCKYAVPEIRRAGGAALIQFTKCIAGDHAKDKIRVNSLSPGGVDTLRTVHRWGSREAANRARGPGHLLGRTGRPEEIAAGALFLASEQSSFMTGADLLFDGGYLAFKGFAAPLSGNGAGSKERT